MKSKRFLTGNTWIIRCLMAIGSNWLHKTAYVENSSGRFMRNITSEETCTSPQRPSVYIKSYRNCFCLWSNVLWRQEHKNAPAAFSWYKFWHWNHPTFYLEKCAPKLWALTLDTAWENFLPIFGRRPASDDSTASLSTARFQSQIWNWMLPSHLRVYINVSWEHMIIFKVMYFLQD